jgi:hypothetical protein
MPRRDLLIGGSVVQAFIPFDGGKDNVFFFY